MMVWNVYSALGRLGFPVGDSAGGVLCIAVYSLIVRYGREVPPYAALVRACLLATAFFRERNCLVLVRNALGRIDGSGYCSWAAIYCRLMEVLDDES